LLAGAGVAAAVKLARDCPGARVLTAETLYPELAEGLAAYDRAVFLDASVQLIAELLRGETTPEILLCLAPSPPGD
jgi:hypothetical protein